MMNLKEIIALVDDSRMRYEEALMRRVNIEGEKRRYTNILITHASDLIKAARKAAELAEAEEASVNAVVRTEEDVVENPSIRPPLAVAVVVNGEGKLAACEPHVGTAKPESPRKGAKKDGIGQA